MTRFMGASRVSSTPEHWQPYARLLCDPYKTVKVVVWLEQDLPPHPKIGKKDKASTAVKKFKTKLTWLTSRMFVSHMEDPVLPGVVVSNLPRS